MSVSVTVNGTSYTIPTTSETGWGDSVKNWIVAISANTLTKAGGTFTLTADIDFGATFGVKSAYFKSRSTNIADAGSIRLANTDTVAWRDIGDTANLVLKPDPATDGILLYNGLALQGSAGLAAHIADVANPHAVTKTQVGLSNVDNTSDANKPISTAEQTALDLKANLASPTFTGTVTSPAFSGPLTGAVTGNVTGNVSGTAASFTGSLVGDVTGTQGATAIAAATVTGKVLTGFSSGAGTVSAADSILTAANKFDGNIALKAPIASPTFTGTVTAPAFSGPLTGNVTGNASGSAATFTGSLVGDVGGTQGATVIGTNKVTNAMLSTVATATFKGRTTAATGNVEDLTATQATALINALVGDSGSGGTKGLAPAPAAGDAAAAKFLKADGTWSTPAGSGGGGSKNYLSTVNGVNGNGSFELGATTGWGLLTVGAVDATTKAVSGSITASAASITTFNTVSSGQLAGSYSLQTASSGALTQGQGFISSAFTIDTADQAKMMTVTGNYKAVSGTMDFSGTKSNTWAIWIYDVTNTTWIQPAGVYSMVQSSGVGKLNATFQTSSNGTQYRLALVCVTATAGATTMYWDDFSVGPQTAPMGPAISDWQAYTPTVAGLGSGGTTQNKARWRRVGDSIEIEGYVLKDGTAGTGASQVGISLPTGMTADSAKINGTQIMSVGSGYFLPGSTFLYLGPVISNDYLNIYFTNGIAGTGDFLKGSAVAADAIFSFTASFPIAGWSSNTVMSNDTDTRVVDLVATTTAAITGGAGSVFIFPTVTKDSHGAYNATTGVYTVPVSGDYHVGAAGLLAATGDQGVLVQVNGTFVNSLTTADATRPKSAYLLLPGLKAGDTVKLVGDTAGRNLLYSASAYIPTLYISRLSGPATIAASEKIYLQYTGNAGTALTADVTNIDFATKVVDSHGAWNGTTFTAPCVGFYNLAACFRITSTVSNNYSVYVNAVSKYLLGGNASSSIKNGAVSLYLNAGDLVTIRSDAAATLSNVASCHWISISSQG